MRTLRRAAQGSQARAAQPVAQCAECGYAICERHARWDADAARDVCSACARRLGLRVISRG